MQLHWKRYSVQEKLALMKKVKKMTEEDGVSMHAAAVSPQNPLSQITCLTKNVDKLTGHASKVAKSLNTG